MSRTGQTRHTAKPCALLDGVDRLWKMYQGVPGLRCNKHLFISFVLIEIVRDVFEVVEQCLCAWNGYQDVFLDKFFLDQQEYRGRTFYLRDYRLRTNLEKMLQKDVMHPVHCIDRSKGKSVFQTPHLTLIHCDLQETPTFLEYSVRLHNTKQQSMEHHMPTCKSRPYVVYHCSTVLCCI